MADRGAAAGGAVRPQRRQRAGGARRHGLVERLDDAKVHPRAAVARERVDREAVTQRVQRIAHQRERILGHVDHAPLRRQRRRRAQREVVQVHRVGLPRGRRPRWPDHAVGQHEIGRCAGVDQERGGHVALRAVAPHVPRAVVDHAGAAIHHRLDHAVELDFVAVAGAVHALQPFGAPGRELAVHAARQLGVAAAHGMDERSVAAMLAAFDQRAPVVQQTLLPIVPFVDRVSAAAGFAVLALPQRSRINRRGGRLRAWRGRVRVSGRGGRAVHGVLRRDRVAGGVAAGRRWHEGRACAWCGIRGDARAWAGRDCTRRQERRRQAPAAVLVRLRPAASAGTPSAAQMCDATRALSSGPASPLRRVSASPSSVCITAVSALAAAVASPSACRDNAASARVNGRRRNGACWRCASSCARCRVRSARAPG